MSETTIQQPTAEPVPPLRLEILPATSRTAAMEIWQKVECDLRSTRMMVSSVWTETWLSHFGQLIPHQFAVAYRGEVACGIGLITQGIGQRNGPIRTQTYHLGTAGEPEMDSACVEYNALLVQPTDRLEFQRAIWTWAGQQYDWEEFRLDGFHEDDVRDWITADPRWTVVIKPARYFDVKTARENNVDPLTLLGPQTRSAIRRSLRRAGSNQCEWAETAADAERIFAELTELHQARWNSDGKPGCYSSRIFHDFHLDLLHRLVPLGLMGLFRVRSDEGTIGCNQVLIDQNRVCIYQSGRILPTDHRLSAGVVVDYMLIEESRRRGFDAVDFLAGDSPHKRRLSTHSTPLAWAVYRRPSLKHSLIDGLRTVKHAIRRTFRSPVKNIDPPKDV